MKRSDSLKRANTTARKASYQEQFSNLKAVEIALQQNWQDEEARRNLSHAQQSLHQLRMEKQDKWRSELDIKWNSTGDSCSKEFFEFHNRHRARRNIKEVVRNGVLTQDPKEIKAAMMEYYTELYKRDKETEGNLIARWRCLISVPSIVTVE